jgi:CheY-like chemotaxis protein
MFKLFRKSSQKTAQAKDVPPSAKTPVKGTVMIVDDDAVVRKALGLKIEAAGYKVLFAADGAEAVTVSRRDRPDVVLLDINFPVEPGVAWDGFKLLRWLHRSPEGARIPVIIITGEDSPKYRDKAMDAGAVGFFQKPLDLAALIAAIDQIVAGSKSKSH